GGGGGGGPVRGARAGRGGGLGGRRDAQRRRGGARPPASRLRRAPRRRAGMVTVRDVRIVPFTIPLRRPLATAAGVVAVRRGFVVVLSDREGREGIGEATPHPAAPPSRRARPRDAPHRPRAPLRGARNPPPPPPAPADS